MTVDFNLQEIDAIARRFWDAYAQHRIFIFKGDLGAGKTTFVRHLCEVLGVKDQVNSPTFAIINEYEAGSPLFTGKVYHMDLYRMRSTEEAVSAGIENCLEEPGAMCFVEWPEQAPELFGTGTVEVVLNTLSADTRRLSVTIL